MIIEYDLTNDYKDNSSNYPEISTIEEVQYSSSSEFFSTYNATYDSRKEEEQPIKYTVLLKKFNKHDLTYPPIKSCSFSIYVSTSASYGTIDITPTKVECFDENNQLLKTIESIDLCVKDSKVTGSLDVDFSDGTVKFILYATLQVKTVGTNQYAACSITPRTLKVDSNMMPALYHSSSYTYKNKNSYTKNSTSVKMFLEGALSDKNSFESTIYSIPQGTKINGNDGEEIGFSCTYLQCKYPFDITLQVYDKDDVLLSSKTTTVTSSSVYPSAIYKEGLNYIKAIVPEVYKSSSSGQTFIQISYSSTSTLYTVYYENNVNGWATSLKTTSYVVNEEKQIPCIFSSLESIGYAGNVQANESFIYHISEIKKKANTTSDVYDVGKYITYKDGDTILVNCGNAYEIVAEKIDDKGNGSTATGRIGPLCFIAKEDDGTILVEKTVETSRQINKAEDIISDTNRTISEELDTLIDTKRIYKNKITTVHDTNRRILGASTSSDVFIGSSLVPLKSSISGKIYYN